MTKKLKLNNIRNKQWFYLVVLGHIVPLRAISVPRPIRLVCPVSGPAILHEIDLRDTLGETYTIRNEKFDNIGHAFSSLRAAKRFIKSRQEHYKRITDELCRRDPMRIMALTMTLTNGSLSMLLRAVSTPSSIESAIFRDGPIKCSFVAIPQTWEDIPREGLNGSLATEIDSSPAEVGKDGCIDLYGADPGQDVVDSNREYNNDVTVDSTSVFWEPDPRVAGENKLLKLNRDTGKWDPAGEEE